MQTSTMMLDSTLGKILAAKQVESPMQVDVDDEPKKDTSSAQSTSSEAEVRLVVKFVVEEQIVYKGKVQRVHQLESEELSRIVSRVAWDGEDENVKGELEGEDGKAQKGDSVESMKGMLANLEMPEEIDEPTSTLAPVKDSSGPLESVNSMLEDSTSNNESSDHSVCKSTPASTKNSTPTKVNSIAQVELPLAVEYEPTIDCDSHSRQPSDDICEIDERSSPIATNIQGAGELQLEEKTVAKSEDKDSDNIEENSIQSPDSIDDVESQSVTETLNDCVNNVDLESQRDAVRSLREDSTNFDLESERIDFIEQKAPVDLGKKSEDVIHKLEVSRTPDNDEKIEKNQSNKQASQDIDHHNYINNGNHSNPPKNSVGEVSGSPTTTSKAKRKGDQNSTGKRIPRTTHKEQRNLTTRTSVSKSIENSVSKQNAALSKMTTVSLLANNQQLRQNKLFAKWSDNHFYPGTILKRANDRKFVIGFFDGAQRNVAESDLIPLCNIEGKQVRVSIAKDYCVNAIVHDQQSPVNDQPIFDVEYQQDGLVRKCVPLKDIFLTPEQGTPLINQVDKISGASNFADVDLDNIIYEKRSRRLQEMEDFDLTENSSINSKRKRGQYNTRNVAPRSRANTPNDCSYSPGQINKRHSQSDISEDPESTGSPDVLKGNFPSSNSNPPSEGSSSTGSLNVPTVLELGQEFYFTSSSPHRTKTSLLL